MLRRLLLFIGLAAMLLAACAPTAAPVPAQATAAPAATLPDPTDVPHAQSLRFALVGPVTFSNVWAYFDKAGADYNNRAMQVGLWPSLYRLSPLSGDVEGYLAEGAFSPVETLPATSLLASTVSLRPGLRWSDGSPLTAEDVAFTVNTALEFQLDLDWGEAYNPARLDRAEALDPLTVRFHFKSQPSVADWQYGALQGPVVNAAFWKSGVELAHAQLATRPALEKDLVNLQAEMAVLQKEMADLLAQGYDPGSKEYEKHQIAIGRKQDDINSVSSRMEKKRHELETVLSGARQALYALDSGGEPTFGPFLRPEKRAQDYVRAASPDYPFDPPGIASLFYRLYPDEEAALSAVNNGDANLALKPGGVTPPKASVISSSMLHPANDIRYLAFNLANPALADPNLRAAIACALWQPEASFLFPADGLVPRSNHFWRNPDVTLPCSNLADEPARLLQAVAMLESAGYAWDVKPAWDGAPVSGSGLKRADGAVIPSLTLLGYESETDSQRLAWAAAIAESVRRLGIPVLFEQVEQADVLYRVFETGQYDMVILGWRLARYPAYLCDLFGAGNPYGYYSEDLARQCETLRATTDMETARQAAFAIQSRLAADLPVAPLYGNVIYDPARGVSYPFQNVLDGLSGLYGAPHLARPSAP